MLALLLLLAAQGPPSFSTVQVQAARDYAPPLQRLSEFLATGDLPGAQALFLGSVAAEQRTAAHHLRLGDIFFALDPPFARAEHARAFELQPDETPVAYAWATELYRSGRCADAEPLFERVSGSSNNWLAALQRVDCLVRTGRLAEALEAWRALRDWQGLAKALRTLPERVGPGDTRAHRRLALRQALAAGSSERAEELVFLEFSRPGGPRPYELERGELEIDRRLVAAHLDPASRRARELGAVCDFWTMLAERGFPPASAGDFAARFGERLRELGWLDAGSEVPGHPSVARWAATLLLESGLRRPSELLADWERALSAQLEEGELEAGRALLEIQRAAGSGQPDETEQLLWDRAHDPDAALALLTRRAERLEAGDPVLRAALERSPGDVRLCALASDCARREGKGEREALARTIAAGFQPPSSPERVRSAFERLEQLLAAGEGR
jgi:hypothetical protein